MKGTFSIGVLMAVLAVTAAQAEFVGDLEFIPAGCEATGKCTIKADFEYKDPAGVRWQTKAQDKTDGASIPSWAQPFVGAPFTKEYIKAAVIHDHYCDRHVRPWRQTHRVFYDALIDSGVSVERAKLLYYAVYLGGPKWVELIPGTGCGTNCVFKVGTDNGFGNDNKDKTILSRPSRYNEPGFPAELKEVEKLIKEGGNNVDLEFLQKRAEKTEPNDFYYKNPDRVTIGGGIAIK
jgi:hypothetical protein